MNRRKLLKSIAIAPLISIVPKLNFAKSSSPIVISTWDAGKKANAKGWQIINTGGLSLDAVEKGVMEIEEEVNCCVGLGGNPDRAGIVTLDACIMDYLGNCGSVAALERIAHPISVARAVMEKTPHVMLVASGAQKFAVEQGFTLMPQTLSTNASEAYKTWLKTSQYKPTPNIENSHGPNNSEINIDEFNHDTIGMLALDSFGNLAGSCTTSGMGFKMRGRVGDSPIIGAGLYVDNSVGAATATGHGEEVIRISGTHLVVEFMRQGMSPEKACKKAVERSYQLRGDKLKDKQIGFIAINKHGEHGAFSLVKGFTYAVQNGTIENVIYKAKYLLEK